MANNTNLSNLVEKEQLREVQLNTLKKINDVISNTAGPFGSYTMIMHNDRLTEYSKDGHKVLSNFKFFRPLEASVHDELLGITEYVIKKVGDGTTTACQLSYYIYSELCRMSEKWEEAGIPPYSIISVFQDIVNELIKRIKENGRELELDDIKEICLISTNGNEMVAEDISNIYKQFGKGVYINIGTSNTESSILKTYDGVILNKGFSSPSFINTDDNTVEIRNPRIYYFPDPVDTPEMIKLFMTIFTENIYIPYQNRTNEYIPTVIMAPSISQDAASALNDIEKIFFAFDQAKRKEDKPPFCIITGINDRIDNIGDIVTLCGCPLIKKYINPDLLKEDIEKGLAPSDDTVTEFYGTADMVTIDIDKMKITNPKEMFDREAPVNSDGSMKTSSTYDALVSFLEKQIEIASMDKNNIETLASLKKRLHNLTANFVEYLIGGVSAADRDNVRDLVEDAVLNCRSAAEYGVGYGAGYEGLRSALDLKKEYCTNGYIDTDIIDIIVRSYENIILNLYKSGESQDDAESLLDETIIKGKVYNLRERSFDGSQVLCSIETDVAILEAISKIITIMYTSNQAMLVDPTQNVYINLKDD